MCLQGQCEIVTLDYTNAFFQMIIREEGVYIKYFPPKNGGTILDIEEFREYLKKNKIKFDSVEFSKKIFSSKVPVFIKTESEKARPVKEMMRVVIKENGLVAACRFIPASTGGESLSKEDIFNELAKNGINYGVCEDEIDKFIIERKYGTDYIFARGKEPTPGSDGRIVELINTVVNRRPKEREDGTVDFFSLDIIPKVEKGGVVAELVKEVEGLPGTDVRGKPILPLKVKRLQVRLGQNVSKSEDEKYVLSNVAGHVMYDGDFISVSNTYFIKGDLDVATGHVIYDGNVEVEGTVISGIRIESSGDVIINGTVEGATIIAEGHIILSNGIKGMGKAVLKAGGNIVAKYLESVEVEAGGYVKADSILNSTIYAKDDITVNSKKGFVSGGHISSGTAIKVKNAGSEMGIRTTLEVGVDPALLNEVRASELKMEWLKKKMEGALPMIEYYGKKIKKGETLPPEKLLQFKIMTLGYKKHAEELGELQTKIEDLNESISNNSDGMIDVQGVVYAGVKVVVINAVLHVKSSFKNCRFIKEEGEVKAIPLV